MPRSRGTTKQTRLSFAPVSSPPAGGEQSPDNGKDRRANLRYGHPSLATVRKNGPQIVGPKTSPTAFVVSKTSKEKLPSIPEEPRRKSLKKKKKDKEHKKEKKDKKKKKNKKQEAEPELPLSDADNDAPQVDLDSESDVPVRISARKKKNKKDLKRKRAPSPTPSSSPPPNISNLAVSDSSDADDIITQPSRKLRRGANAQPTIVLDDSSDESEEEPVRSSPVKRRRLMRSSEVPQTPRRGQDQAELDIEEDLEDLQDSVVKETRTRGRLANSARAQRQQHLEALRRRRAGNKSPTHSDNDEESESGSESAESSSDDEKPAIRRPRFSYEQQDSDVESAIASDEDLDQYEEDFVLQDEDENTMGVPTDVQGLPFEFSRHAYKQLKDYFQDAVEWMVHNQLNPAFPRDSPIYEFAFQKLEDEVKGRTGSQLVSSVWTSSFTRALLARPQMEITSYPTSDNHPCDACKRSGHPASSDIKFYGKAYSLETLEPLADNSDEDEDDSEKEDDGIERDKDGYELPDEDTRFYLGRHCKTKAEMAHTLTHWRFHLNEWVIEHLRCMGYLTDKEVLKRSHWKQKRKEKYAAEVVGKMIEDNEVKKLWRDFHITLRAARESAQ